MNIPLQISSKEIGNQEKDDKDCEGVNLPLQTKCKVFGYQDKADSQDCMENNRSQNFSKLSLTTAEESFPSCWYHLLYIFFHR